jgi:hypothetical protein
MERFRLTQVESIGLSQEHDDCYTVATIIAARRLKPLVRFSAPL